MKALAQNGRLHLLPQLQDVSHSCLRLIANDHLVCIRPPVARYIHTERD